jgi:hypothetical protein
MAVRGVSLHRKLGYDLMRVLGAFGNYSNRVVHPRRPTTSAWRRDVAGAHDPTASPEIERRRYFPQLAELGCSTIFSIKRSTCACSKREST